jgi:membrane protein YdbS with pleckstrin-like domain
MNTILFALGIGSFFLYFPMEARKVKGHYLETKLDKKIPMLSGFVIPYILFFPYVFGVYIWAYATKDPNFAQLAISITAVSIITTVIYVGFPSVMARPFSGGGLIPKGWAAHIVEAIEKFDKPNNVFPSNHVAYSLVITLFLILAFPAYIWLFDIIFILIASSTILIK